MGQTNVANLLILLTMQLVLQEETVDSQKLPCLTLHLIMSEEERFTLHKHIIVYPNRWFLVVLPLQMDLGRYVTYIAIFGHRHKNT